jgi:hypothetical protein
MNDPKSINRQEAAAKYSLSSSIRASSDKFTANPLVGMGQMPVFIRTSLRMFGVWQRFAFAYAIPVAAVSGAVVGTYLLGSTIKYTPNLFFCAVVLSSWLGGVGGGIFAVFLSVIALDYYFIPPIYALGIGLEEAPDMMVFVVSATFMTWLNRGGDSKRNSIGRAPVESDAKASQNGVGFGTAERLQRPGISRGELARESLVQTRNGASSTKCEKNINKSPNPTVNELGTDEECRLRFRVRAPHRDKTEVVLFDGALGPLPDPHPYSRRDLVFCKHGEYWTTKYEGEEAWFKATRGLECLACLLGNPGREFHVTELIGAVTSVTELPLRRVHQDGDQITTVHLEDAGPILDGRAKAEYKLRLAELRTELEEAERFNDLERAERIEEESGVIAGQLAVAVGLGGRNRRTASHAERARSAITKRIRGSIQRIAKTSPSLGRHLAASIKTGYFCSYDPDPDCSIRWKLGS